MNLKVYYGIVETKRDGKDVWATYPLRDARAAERFYRRPPEGRVISVGYRTRYRTLPILTGWTLNGTGAEATLHVHGAWYITNCPAWARRAAKAGKGRD